MPLAVTREVSPRFNECEITHIERTPIDVDIVRSQHRSYVNTLEQLGCTVLELPAEADLPDSVFVEDTAFILPEAVVITRPGADSRRPETESIAQALSSLTKLLFLREPATLDGGDVLVMEKTIWIGQGSRTNREGVRQVRQFVHPHGYLVLTAPVRGCLHLKSAVTRAAGRTLLINPDWVDESAFLGFGLIKVDPQEPYGANILLVGDRLVYQPAFPRTLARLEEAGFHPLLVDASELGKAEGALTCCSLLFNTS